MAGNLQRRKYFLSTWNAQSLSIPSLLSFFLPSGFDELKHVTTDKGLFSIDPVKINILYNLTVGKEIMSINIAENFKDFTTLIVQIVVF
jgi:hypothetical protein